MTIRSDLIKELDFLIGMMPVWQKWEQLKLLSFKDSGHPADFAEYTEAHWRAFFMMEKVAFINKLLGENYE